MLRFPNTYNPEKESKGDKRKTEKWSEIVFESKIYDIRIVVNGVQETVFLTKVHSRQKKFRVSEEKNTKTKKA